VEPPLVEAPNAAPPSIALTRTYGAAGQGSGRIGMDDDDDDDGVMTATGAVN
jgi:hypothetical protein